MEKLRKSITETNWWTLFFFLKLNFVIKFFEEKHLYSEAALQRYC